MSKCKKGGLRRINPDRTTSFESLYKMINNDFAGITRISSSSLKGFIFKLDILRDPSKDDNIQYLGAKIRGLTVKMDAPVYSIILKFAIITEVEERLEDFHIHKKKSESASSFCQEADIQSNIYKTTIMPNGFSICPSVINLSFFNEEAANILLELLFGKISQPDVPDPIIYDMFGYLTRNVVGKKLGLIAMELANDEEGNVYKQLSDIRDARRPALCIITQMLRLFMQIKAIHIDLHSGNSLVKADGSHAFLIDFGSITDLEHVRTSIAEKYDSLPGCNLMADVGKYNLGDIATTGVDLFPNHDINDIKKTICDILRIIACFDYASLFINYRKRYSTPQINEILEIFNYGYSDDWITNPPNWDIPGRERNAEFQEIYDKYIMYTQTDISKTSTITRSIIQRYEADGSLFTFNAEENYDVSDELIALVNPRKGKAKKSAAKKGGTRTRTRTRIRTRKNKKSRKFSK